MHESNGCGSEAVEAQERGFSFNSPILVGFLVGNSFPQPTISQDVNELIA
jgi:hypothetical protein